MATLAQLDAQVAALVEALAAAPTRFVCDYRDDLEKIPAGASRYQLRVSAVTADESHSSNEAYLVALVTVVIHHRLNVAEAVRDYTLGNAATDSSTMMAEAFWSALAAVYDVTEGPGIDAALDRVGNVLSYSAAVQVRVQP